ncbi:MAG: S41 family peptidase [Oscillospiraceae bacterium]|jgi:C-terminal processing protease CtpA/Prc
MEKKKRKISVIIWIAAALAAAAICFVMLDPHVGTADPPKETLDLSTVLTEKQAEEDLRALYRIVRRRHPAWVDGNTEAVEAFENCYQQEMEAVDGPVTVLELWRAAERIAATLEDGHTSVRSNSYSRELLDFRYPGSGEEIAAINGEDAEAVYSRFCTMDSAETEATHSGDFLMNIVKEDYLELMGVDTSDGVDVTYRQQDGSEYTVHYELGDPQEPGSSSSEPYFSWEIDSGSLIGIFDLNQCEYNEEYCQELDAFFSKAVDAGCRAVVVDLRDNPGGSSQVINEFLRHLDVDSYRMQVMYTRIGPLLLKFDPGEMENDRCTKVFSGMVFAITNVNTFSSAMDFAMVLKDNGIGTIVGEASGNLPDSYGDALTFSLPNSHLQLSVSYKKWSRVDASAAGLPVEPDITCNPEDALEEILKAVGNS